MQHCQFCGIDEAFQAVVIHSKYDIPNSVIDAGFLHRLVGHPIHEHDLQVAGTSAETGWSLHNARPCETWPMDREGRYMFRDRVDVEVDLDHIAFVAARINAPQWRERIQMLRHFRYADWFRVDRRIIDQIVQQEWIGARAKPVDVQT